MRITDHAGCHLATEAFDAFEQGAIPDGCVARAKGYGLGTHLDMIRQCAAGADVLDRSVADLQLQAFAYRVGRVEGSLHAADLWSRGGDEPGARTVLREYADALATWIPRNNADLARLIEAAQGDSQAAPSACAATLSATGRMRAIEYFVHGFVDGLGHQWLRRVAPTLIDGLSAEAEAVIRTPLLGPDQVEADIVGESAVLAGATSDVPTRVLLLAAGQRAIRTDVADADALLEIHRRFVASHKGDEDPMSTLQRVRHDLRGLYYALAEHGCTRGRISVTRAIGLLLTPDDLTRMLAGAEIGHG